ncbi:hypothetical protein C8R46DRAFT_1048339 [Mycena filopes]|nr:hypothetical protein C8R46DRAFT_1048339 [Mycena filopes]
MHMLQIGGSSITVPTSHPGQYHPRRTRLATDLLSYCGRYAPSAFEDEATLGADLLSYRGRYEPCASAWVCVPRERLPAPSSAAPPSLAACFGTTHAQTVPMTRTATSLYNRSNRVLWLKAASGSDAANLRKVCTIPHEMDKMKTTRGIAVQALKSNQLDRTIKVGHTGNSRAHRRQLERLDEAGDETDYDRECEFFAAKAAQIAALAVGLEGQGEGRGEENDTPEADECKKALERKQNIE